MVQPKAISQEAANVLLSATLGAFLASPQGAPARRELLGRLWHVHNAPDAETRAAAVTKFGDYLAHLVRGAAYALKTAV